MKVSVSLTQDDLARVDAYVRSAGLASRSAAIQQAVRQLEDVGLQDAYVAAWDEWASTSEPGVWERTSGDGLDDAAR